MCIAINSQLFGRQMNVLIASNCMTKVVNQLGLTIRHGMIVGLGLLTRSFHFVPPLLYLTHAVFSLQQLFRNMGC